MVARLIMTENFLSFPVSYLKSTINLEEVYSAVDSLKQEITADQRDQATNPENQLGLESFLNHMPAASDHSVDINDR